MATSVTNRRSVMTLFSDPTGLDSHAVRMALSEKGINVEIIDVDPEEPPEDLLDLNPYSTAPTLVDRDLVLYEPQVVMEYLDERFPHPPLMPVDPVMRARFRSGFYRIREEWYALAEIIESGTDKQANQARKELKESLLSSAGGFSGTVYFLNDEFSLVDCTIAPLLWRLRSYKVELGAKGRPILEYAKRVIQRPSFRESLSEYEREITLS